MKLQVVMSKFVGHAFDMFCYIGKKALWFPLLY